MTTNPTVDFLGESRRQAIPSPLPPQDPDPEEEALRAERRRLLGHAISRLTPRDQLFARLIYVDGESGEHVARLLGTTVGAVHTRKNRLRKHLGKPRG